MSGAIPNVPQTLSAKQGLKAFWYASLLDNLVHEHDCSELRAACVGSGILTIQSAERLAKRVLSHLKKLPKRSLFVTFWEHHRSRWELHHTPSTIENESDFVSTFSCELRTRISRYSEQIVRRITVFPQYTGEYLSSIVATTLNALHAKQKKNSYLKHFREYFTPEYPFLEDKPDATKSKAFGAARHQQVHEECMKLLSTSPYQDSLRLAIASTLINAPQGRQHYWATCMASVVRGVNAVDVAEALNFPSGVPGLMRARVLVSRVTRKTHDTFFKVLCHRKLMTIKLAEFMAQEYRMPIEVVREGMRSVRLSSKRAELYAVSSTAAKVPEVD